MDGTLCHSVGENANRLHKEAFVAAFAEVFKLDTTIDVVPHHGSTDPLILVRVLQHHGVPKEEVRWLGGRLAALRGSGSLLDWTRGRIKAL